LIDSLCAVDEFRRKLGYVKKCVMCTIATMQSFIRPTLMALSMLTCIGLGLLWWRSYTWSDGTWSSSPYTSVFTANGKVIVRFTGNPFNDPIDFAELWRRIAVEPVNPPSTDSYYDAVPQAVQPTWWEKESVMGFAWLEKPPGGTWINFPLWAPMAVLGGVGVCAWFKPQMNLGLFRRRRAAK
jgi:hypothetical protein